MKFHWNGRAIRLILPMICVHFVSKWMNKWLHSVLGCMHSQAMKISPTLFEIEWMDRLWQKPSWKSYAMLTIPVGNIWLPTNELYLSLPRTLPHQHCKWASIQRNKSHIPNAKAPWSVCILLAACPECHSWESISLSQSGDANASSEWGRNVHSRSQMMSEGNWPERLTTINSSETLWQWH